MNRFFAENMILRLVKSHYIISLLSTNDLHSHNPLNF